ncbi:HAF repeat-containing protein [Geobacter sp. DSM 9736]|uniref:HAF repeat-containing protein n=1 Tax=Geobacter sp. DSM 9736 TaxID=1277350 RepID=UPI000B509FE8|nr:HAF repeat-containing protein [Geobacter sp. DSM 9736]SNB46928.1 probable extracellular repeat, HAF family [Geobacter sp. DSM 9736]
MNSRWPVQLLTVLVLTASQASARSPEARTTSLGTLGGAGSTAVAINDKGTVAGFSDTATPNIEHAFIWKNGRMTDLGALGKHESSRAKAINNNDEIVGDSFVKGAIHAFLWKKGKMIDLGTLGGKNSFAIGINDRGEVIGNSETSKGKSHAFLWKEGKMIDLGTLGGASSTAVAINEQGEVAGYSQIKGSGKATHAFIWRRNRMTDLGALSRKWPTYASDLNDKGEVIGDGYVSGSRIDGYILKNGRLADLGKPASESTSPHSTRTLKINNRGQIIGGLTYPDGTSWGFFRENGTMTRIKGVGKASGSTLYDINGKGWTVGSSSIRDEDSTRLDRAFLWCNGNTISLGAERGELTQALSINEAGQVVGWRKEGKRSDNLWQRPSKAVLWKLPEGACEQETVRR